MNFDFPFACFKDLLVEREEDRLSYDTVSTIYHAFLTQINSFSRPKLTQNSVKD